MRHGRTYARSLVATDIFPYSPGCEPPAVRLPPPRARRARLDPAARMERRHRRAVGERPVAAGPLREERAPAAGGDGGPAGGPPLRRPRARPGRAGHDVDAAAAADAQHDGPGDRRLGRWGAP